MGQGATAALLLHTVTQGPRDSPPCGSTKCSGGLLTRCIHLAMSTDQGRAGQIDRKCQEARESHSQLVPLLAGLELHGERDSEMQNSMNTVHLGAGDSTLTHLSPHLCSQLHPRSSGRLPTVKNKIRVHHANQRSTSKAMRKHCPLLSKQSLLAVPTHFLPFHFLQEREHIVLEPPTRSRSMASCPSLMTATSSGQKRKTIIHGFWKEAAVGRQGTEVRAGRMSSTSGDPTGFHALISGLS